MLKEDVRNDGIRGDKDKVENVRNDGKGANKGKAESVQNDERGVDRDKDDGKCMPGTGTGGRS